MDTNNDNWVTPAGQQIFETLGKQFLTLPASADFTGIKKEILRKNVLRDKVPAEHYLREGKYLFLALDYLETIRDQSERFKKLIHLEEIHQVKLKDEDYKEFLQWKLKQQKSKTAPKKKQEAGKSKKVKPKASKQVAKK